VHYVHENLQNKNGLPHTVAEWYVRLVHKNLLKEYGLPHTVAKWYVHLIHKDLPIKNGLLHTVNHVPDTYVVVEGSRQEKLRAEETPEE